MRKILLSLLITLSIVTPCLATVYYGGAASKDINANDLWYEGVTGSCAGDGSPVAWATVNQAGNVLVANGCTITIPNTANLTVSVDKISNKETDTPDADSVAGGQFTYVTSASYVLTVNSEIEGGGATGATLAITGSAAGTDRVILLGSITGGSATAMYGVNGGHTGGSIRLGADGSPITVTGGSNLTAFGYRAGGNGGTTIVYAHCVAATAPGCELGTGGAAVTHTGTCTGSDLSDAEGCHGNASATTYNFVGNIINGTRANGIGGNFSWTPSSSNYWKITNGTAVYVSKAPDKTKVTTDTYVVNHATGDYEPGEATAGSGGGGAWAY